MNETKRKCYWCENETDMPYTYYAMGPISEKYELLLLEFEKKYGGKWFDSEEIEPKLLVITPYPNLYHWLLTFPKSPIPFLVIFNDKSPLYPSDI